MAPISVVSFSSEGETDADAKKTPASRPLLITVPWVSLPTFLMAQSSGSTQNPSGEPDGVTSGGYLIHSSGELGYRSTDISGSGNMYDTLVNLQQGPRFLDETLSMQSLDHQGLLFDNLFVNSFGWGGDPNNALRLRADKNKWYNLQGSFRRDQSFSDFDLLANPLNPSTSTPSIQAQNSPHLFDTVRRMSDFDLTLLPQSRVSFRLGFSHNNMTGPSYSSIHEGTDALLLQGWNTTMNSYRFGVDWKAAAANGYQLRPIPQLLQGRHGLRNWLRSRRRCCPPELRLSWACPSTLRTRNPVPERQREPP